MIHLSKHTKKGSGVEKIRHSTFRIRVCTISPPFLLLLGPVYCRLLTFYVLLLLSIALSLCLFRIINVSIVSLNIKGQKER